MDDSDIPYTERELIQRAINSVCASHAFKCNEGRAAPRLRWDIVRHAFGTGSTVSTAICYRYGFDAERMIGETTNG